jgi:hypothetical protein
MQRIISKLIPFLLAGIAIVAFAFGILLLAYLFLFGAIIGLILFLITWIRNTFFPRKLPTKTHKKTGRIIDSDDWKKL